MITSDELIKLFTAAKEYISSGISIVPIDDITGRRLISYSKNPDATKNLDEIFKILSASDGNLKLAIITGKLSKNLECIDIDEKYCPGISAQYLAIIKEFYADLYNRLRIEQTRNKGLHIYYTLDGEQSSKKDIAERLATPEELAENPKRKKIAFIEIKGNNASFTCYPSVGYTLLEDNPIPHLSQQERDTLVNVAKSFNRVIEKVVEIKVSPKMLRNYSTDPWTDYNNDETALLNLLNKHGWSVVTDRGNEARFSRPGQKKLVSACYYRDKQIFIVFSTSTGIDAGNYRPSALLAKLNFNDDKKETFAWLVDNGYGKLNRNFETRLIEKAVVNNNGLPANISDAAKEIFSEKKSEFEEKYPHGIFWEQIEDNDEITYRINRELILRVSIALNFRLYRGDLVFIDKKIIRRSDATNFYKALKSYVREDDKINIMIYDKVESYLQQSGKYLISRLEKVEEDEILHDEYRTCYKAFNNVVLKINKCGITPVDWCNIDKLILEEKVIPNDFIVGKEGGKFVEFLKLSIFDHHQLREKIGWMVHDYNDSITPYYMVLTEVVINPKDGGGSGKDLFTNMIGMMTTLHVKDGKNLKVIDEKFLQSWRNQRLMLLADVKERFDFAQMNTITANAATVKRLYQNEISVPVQHLPKFIFTSNYSFTIKDGGVDRRLRFIEFSDFFTKCGGVAAHFDGVRFPRTGMEDDWAEDDWNGYYNYMINSIVAYFNNPILKNVEMTETGWKKQFAMNHGDNTLEFIEENIGYLKERHFISQSDFQDLYNKFCAERSISDRFKKSSHGMNEALEDYCKHDKITFIKTKNRTSNGITVNCKVFGDGDITVRSYECEDIPF